MHCTITPNLYYPHILLTNLTFKSKLTNVMKRQNFHAFQNMTQKENCSTFGIISHKLAKDSPGNSVTSSFHHQPENTGYGRKNELMKDGKKELYKFVGRLLVLSGMKPKELPRVIYGLGSNGSYMLKAQRQLNTTHKNQAVF